MEKTASIIFTLYLFLAIPFQLFGQGEVIERIAKNTVTPLEMNIGDTLKFTLRNEDVRTLVLKNTAADVIITNLNELKVDQPGGAMLYHFTAEIEIDGHSMKMERYVGSQETFYEPYVINGMRIWFDAVLNISELLNDTHRSETYDPPNLSCECLPNKDARFAVMDMTDRIAPEELSSWYENKENFISIADAYNGDDPWMGPYNGTEIHGALDINYPPGTPNYTPITIDNHSIFNKIGDEPRPKNNRWRGIRQWSNGDTWTLQAHHLLKLRVPENRPITAGVHYADFGGVFSGLHHHGHYIFKARTHEDVEDIWIDPWIIFWQTFEDNKKRSGEIKASISPLKPHITGEPVAFSSESSASGINRSELSFYWTFGDGGLSIEASPEYTYTNPGIYPVTLVVDDGAKKASFTQHITIDGEVIDEPALILIAENEPSFRIRPVQVMDVYGIPINTIPHSVHFLARETRPYPNKKVIKLENVGGGVLSNIKEPVIEYFDREGWLSIENKGEGNDQKLFIGVDASEFEAGVYTAEVTVESVGALNPRQKFLIQLTVPVHAPSHPRIGNVRDGLQYEVIHHSDIRYKRFYSTPYFWVGPQFHRWEAKGYGEYYLTNGGRPREGEFARFTPDLEEGTYEISFASETPFDPKQRAISGGIQYPVNPELNPNPRFAVRVHSKEGDEIIWVEPIESNVIGTFDFFEGMDGYVEILAEGSNGQVLIDAIIFNQIQ